MKARAYLGQLNKLDCVIRNKSAEIEHWQDVAVDCTVHMDGERVHSSGSKQRMESAVVTYSDLQAELAADIKRAQEKKQEIIKTLELLPANQYDVLHRIYVQGMMLKHVVSDLNRSHTWVCDTHRKALRNLQKILDTREQETES